MSQRPATLSLSGRVLLALAFLAGLTAPGLAASLTERPLALPAGGSLDWRVKALGYGRSTEPADSDLNPGNANLAIVRYEAHAELRPDLTLTWPDLSFSLKPRLDVFHREWDSGPMAGRTDDGADAYFNEALARWSFHDEVFLSCGRENPQWGPSFLLSPSNPFQFGNGRDNPVLELPGMDFVRAVWVPDPAWTLSVIGNFDEGRRSFFQPLEEFRRGAAVKADWTGNGRYATLIASRHEGDGDRMTLGGYAGQSLGDATLVYIEGNVPGDAAEAQVLVGGSYTFPWLGMLSVEYYRNGRGTRSENLIDAFAPLGGQALPSDLFYRRNYLFAQYFDQFGDRTEVTLRWTYGLDDGSSRMAGIVSHALSDAVECFALATVEEGGRRSEFDSFIEYSVMAGVSVSY